MVKSRVFLAISYTKGMKVENAIIKYLESKGLEVITGRDVASGGNLCHEIINLIQECDFGVVVYNELRHNISYEWGLMDAFKKTAALLKDESMHIELDKEVSDTKGIIYTPFYGEDTEDEIIEQLKKNKGLERALENNIEKRISGQKTQDAKKAAELLVKSDFVLGSISPESIKDLPNSKELIKSLEKIKNLTAEGHFIKGYAYYSARKFDKAIEDYNKAIELNPKLAEAYNNRGVVYIYIKEFDKAIKDYNKAIELDPKYAEAYNNRGAVYSYIK
ncbi:MAG: tetratricopeptide repeat protein [Candidatus Methanoperedens sp.]|nr:tetratricopeptide repeat protein [Candidatus Methanoperedens sp.]MCZ7406603.1 tetratricopeptide repeat protein [Candidatus Methanoperedens sp.]